MVIDLNYTPQRRPTRSTAPLTAIVSGTTSVTGSETQRGSVFLELLWTLPAFAAGLALILFLGVQINARSALQDAVTSGLGLAVTRAHGIEGRPGALEAVDNYVNLVHSKEAPAGSQELTSLSRLIVSREHADWISSPELETNLSSAYAFTFYDPDYNPANPGAIPLFSSPSPTQLYALAYIFQAMELHTLGDVVFPCDPRAMRPGCLSCRFFPGGDAARASGNPNQFSNPGNTSFDEIFNRASPNQRITLKERRISISCFYRPKHIFIDLLVAIAEPLGLNVSSFGTVGAVAAIDNR